MESWRPFLISENVEDQKTLKKVSHFKGVNLHLTVMEEFDETRHTVMMTRQERKALKKGHKPQQTVTYHIGSPEFNRLQQQAIAEIDRTERAQEKMARKAARDKRARRARGQKLQKDLQAEQTDKATAADKQVAEAQKAAKDEPAAQTAKFAKAAHFCSHHQQP